MPRRFLSALRRLPSGLACLSLLASVAAAGDRPETALPAADPACTQAEAAGAVLDKGVPGDPFAPEPASGYRPRTRVLARSYMVVTAHPLASQAGCEVLRQGGSAVDAAVAVQMVLGLVEPQSSGLGGGAFMLHYNAASRQVLSYDGRETAPAAATEDYLRHTSAGNLAPPLPVRGAPEAPSSFNLLRQSGRSIGTPGVVRMLELAHQAHGRRPWKDLFQHGIRLARDGFPIGGRLADAIAGARLLLTTDPEAAAYFLYADGSARVLGSPLRNPAYAETLTRLAHEGARAMYTGAVAQGIVQKIGMTRGGNPSFEITPGLTDLSDLATYQAHVRPPVCTTYRAYWICGMGTPSSGGITVAATLGILENFDLPGMRPQAMDRHGGQPSALGVHLISEAERLAYADRNMYVADTDFVPLPGGSPDALLDKRYLRRRAQLIETHRSMGTAAPGVFATGTTRGSSDAEGKGTTHMTIVDPQGNVVVMTSTIESSMGAFRMTHGFLLNNQLTDFSVLPSDAAGSMANRVEARKRPRSSMAPTLVFTKNADGSMGDFVLGTGSPGGSAIVQYVTKTLIGVLDWGMDAQQATSMIDFGAANSPVTSVGGEHPNVNTQASPAGLAGSEDGLVSALRARGHVVSVSAQSSGIGTIVRIRHGAETVLEGGADPRREGVALGDTLTP